MIPRVLHQIWVGGPVPPWLAEMRQTWLELHPSPGWEHILWTDDDLPPITHGALYDDPPCPPATHGQMRADLLRYDILFRYGGVYVDLDFEAQRPIDELLAGIDCFAAWETDDVWIGNAILGSTPGHPFLAELIAGVPASVEAHRGQRPVLSTGPQYLTPIAKRHDVRLFPASMFYPYRWDQLERGDELFPDAYAIHHWNNRRIRTGRTKHVAR